LNKTFLYWNIESQEIDSVALQSVDHVIHLAGANIGEKRWTKKQRQIILNSRINATSLLYNTIYKQSHKPKTFISASAIGIYGAVSSENIFTESDAAANDFLGTVCTQWEAAADSFQQLGIRVVKLRTAVVLTPQKGILAKLVKPIQYYLGAIVGNGKQYFPWIHIDDLCEMYYKAIVDHSMNGSYNAVSPQHINNRDFTRKLAEIVHKPLLIPAIPSFIFTIILGKMSQLVLEGSRISSKKIIDSGFIFRYPTIEKAFQNLFDNVLK
jgi:uncharacterized protein (TIGR01777 family)